MLEAISPPPLFKRPEQLAKQLPDQLASPPVKRPAALKTPVKLPMDMFTSTPAHNRDSHRFNDDVVVVNCKREPIFDKSAN